MSVYVSKIELSQNLTSGEIQGLCRYTPKLLQSYV